MQAVSFDEHKAENRLFLLLCHGAVCWRLVATGFIAFGGFLAAGLAAIRESTTAWRPVVVVPVHKTTPAGEQHDHSHNAGKNQSSNFLVHLLIPPV